MNNYAYLIKAKAKATEAKSLFCWFSAKSDSRAEREILNILEDEGLNVGRSADHQLPIRTDFPVFDDLPEEGSVDFTWCERYELQDDGRTWLPKIAGAVEATNQADVKTTVDDAFAGENISLENRTPAVRFAVHLTSDKYLTHISKDQLLTASEMSLEEGNTYLHSLLQARSETPEVAELSMNAEWKLIQAIKEAFPQDENPAPETLAFFMSSWASADSSERNQLVEDRKATAHQNTVYQEGTGNAGQNEDNGHESKIVDVAYNLAPMGFRVQLLAQFIAEDLHVYCINKETQAQIASMEMDTDNTYVQNLLLAAENVPEVKTFDMPTLWKFTAAVKAVFPQDKRNEMSLIMRFVRIWVSTEHIDRGLLVKEWVKGNRVTLIQRTDVKTNAGGGNKTDRNPDLVHTLDTLDLDIALATLPMDFNIYDIPGGGYRRAKEIVSKKESPFKEWSEALRKTAGILDYSRAAIFALIRGTSSELVNFPNRLQAYINANLTETDHEHPTVETLTAAGHVPEKSWENEINEKVVAEQKASAKQPEIANTGNGVFSIDNLIATPEKPTEETTDVQMEEALNDETAVSSEIPISKAAADAVAGDVEDGGETDPMINGTGHHNDDYRHVMVDLETMGNKSNAPIVSIGAMFFNPNTGNTGAEFYTAVSLESAMLHGGVPDAGTIIWWLKQSPEARSAISMADTMTLIDALELFSDFISENSDAGSDVQVWGNGASFDNVILRSSYDRANIECPWNFRNDRDMRTMTELGKAIGINPRYDIPFDGDMHNALSDARHQVKYVSAIWQKLIRN